MALRVVNLCVVEWVSVSLTSAVSISMSLGHRDTDGEAKSFDIHAFALHTSTT